MVDALYHQLTLSLHLRLFLVEAGERYTYLFFLLIEVLLSLFSELHGWRDYLSSRLLSKLCF